MTDFRSNADLHISRNKHIIKGLRAPFWLYPEKPLTTKTAFVICLVYQFGSTELSSTFDSNRCSFNYLSRPKLPLGSTHVKYGAWPGPQGHKLAPILDNLILYWVRRYEWDPWTLGAFMRFRDKLCSKNMYKSLHRHLTWRSCSLSMSQ